MISNLSLTAAVAWAADVAPAAAAGGGSALTSFLPLIAIIAIMYFLMIRPQQKRQKEHQAMLSAIQKGDRVQTNGGILGTVTGLDTAQGELTVEIAPQVRVKVGRGYIARVIRPGAAAPAPADKGEKAEKK